MEKIQLTHPEGKKGVSMDKIKYEVLRTSFLACLKTKKVAPFQELLSGVEKDLKKRKVKIEGKLEWNLFWVTLDLVAKKELCKNKTLSPITYTLSK
jgi:hypothetical protein